MAIRIASPYVKQTKTELEEAAKEVGISYEQGVAIVDIFFKALHSFLDDERMPIISVPFMGRFRPTLGSLRRNLRMNFRLYRQTKLPREIVLYRVKKFYPIRKRLIYEKNKIKTWKWWYRIPKNWMQKTLTKETEFANYYYYKGGKEKWDKANGRFLSDLKKRSKTDR